jgi:hypothetical protein
MEKWSFFCFDCPVCGQQRGSTGRMIQHINKSKRCKRYILMKQVEFIKSYFFEHPEKFIDEKYILKSEVEKTYVLKERVAPLLTEINILRNKITSILDDSV